LAIWSAVECRHVKGIERLISDQKAGLLRLFAIQPWLFYLNPPLWIFLLAQPDEPDRH